MRGGAVERGVVLKLNPVVPLAVGVGVVSGGGSSNENEWGSIS